VPDSSSVSERQRSGALHSKAVGRVAWVVFSFNTLGLLVAGWDAWLHGVRRESALAFVLMYVLTIAGVGVGFHLLLAHRSFRTSRWLSQVFAVLGSMAGQGSALYWVSHHRRHHRFSDRPGDPHSPHLQPPGRFARLRGVWHSHIGWALSGAVTDPMLYARDMLRDPGMRRVNRLYFVWVLLGLLLPTIAVGLIGGDARGIWEGFLWGGVARMALVQHAVALTGSLGHIAGARTFASDDRSTNNAWLSLVTFGGTMHNTHHTFPSAAITALSPWQLVPSDWLILGLRSLGLVWDVKRPSLQRLGASLGSLQSTDAGATLSTAHLECDDEY
jgi:stearoyl-CoA desaturase (Delta-9 desaturase)